MKELSIEEKAKRYDEAIEKLHEIITMDNKPVNPKEIGEYLFPELEESEDERIRKQIISFLKEFEYDHYRCLDFSSWIAWLENQDFNYTFEIKEGHWYKCVCDYMLNNSDVMFKYDRLYYCRRDWRLDGEIDEINVKNIGVNGYKSFFRPATNQEIKDWLEKQGKETSMKVYRVENEAEQKGLWRKFDGTYEPLFDMLTDGQCRDLPMEDSPVYREGGKRWFASAPSKETLQKWFSKRDLEELVANGFTISEFEVVGYKKVSDFEYIFTRDNILNRNYLEVSDIYPEQKDFEPKFKVGDWVVQENIGVYKVIEICKSWYEVIDSEDNHYSISFDKECMCHLWTIDDANEGDVLCTYECGEPKIVFFLKGTPKKHRALRYYCYYNIMYPYFEYDSETGCLAPNKEDIKPATNEQRDKLEKAMLKAWYKWNKEERKLEKT